MPVLCYISISVPLDYIITISIIDDDGNRRSLYQFLTTMEIGGTSTEHSTTSTSTSSFEYIVNVRRSSSEFLGKHTLSVCPADTAELGVAVIFTIVSKKSLKVFTNPFQQKYPQAEGRCP